MTVAHRPASALPVDPKAFLAYCRPTFLTDWPEPLQRLSFRTEFVYLDEAEVLVLRRGPLWKGPVWGMSDPTVDKLMGKLRQGLDAMGGAAFLRTHVRSPKDGLLWQQHAGRVDHPWFALVMLQESERFHGDAQWLALDGALPVIALREWVPTLPGLEFRCFVHDREVVGIAQRPGRTPRNAALQAHAALVQARLTTFAQECTRRSGLPSAVYDLCLRRQPDEALTLADIRLVEVNPWHSATDRFAFEARRDGGFDGSFRFVA
ncbi:hypothetical protein [Rhizobacter sp. LjRoot28]|uniref:hypothetical protein n=1 Tax=Rhizobacter sp. LjRoot28 TaxID=3342309 RepID=UPI003ECC2DB6